MKRLLFLAVVAVGAGIASAAHVVRTGSIAEGGFGVATAETLTKDGCGTLLNLFHGKWTPEKVRAVGAHCRKHGCTFTMDEMFNRWSGDWKPEYAPVKDELLAALREYADVCEGTQHYSESGGLMFYWHPKNAMHRGQPSPRIAKGGHSLAQAYAETCAQTRRDLQQAKDAGLPGPIFSIECAFGFSPFLLRAGYDRVDLEVVYSDELERSYAGAKTAAEAFGRRSFGTDMAMDWYGGMQSDGLWEARWRTSLYHAYVRGADPIYNEHGLMSLKAHGRTFEHDDPVTRRYRKVLADFTSWCKVHPRADGYPLATVGAIQGRFDGYVGIFQTHLFGQRANDAFRVTEADRTAWRLFDGLYRRRGWQERDSWGDADYSGNPPLGAAGILPFDASAVEFAKYKFLFFLGRNVMDAELYGKLVAYVKGGGTLMLAASHLTVQDAPDGAFVPYNGGDWSELVGVKVRGGKPWHLPHGMKFVKNPGPHWNFQPLTNVWDPDFIEGGFDVPELETTTAKPFVVASDNFVEKKIADCRGIGFVNEIGKGRVVFLASLDSPGAFGVRKLYSFLLAKAMEAVGADTWPKVECNDTVRWSVYPDGTIYLLNTEAHLSQDVIVERSKGAARETMRLVPGELKPLAPPSAATKAGEVGSVVRVKVGDSLNEAVARARTLPKPVTLRLEPGVHELSDTLRLGPEDSGLVFESAAGAQAILSGGRRVAGWSRNEDGTWRTHVQKGRPFHQLTVNGARAARCRHPNTGCFMAAGEEIPFVTNSVTPSAGGRRHPALVYDPKDIDFAALARPDMAEIRVFHWWVDSHLTIGRVDAVSNKVWFARPADYYVGLHHNTKKPGLYCVENVREFLDAPGEWYCDHQNGILEYLPRAGECPGAGDFAAVVPKLRELVTLTGDPVKKREYVADVVFRGVAFRDADAGLEPGDINSTQGSAKIGAALILSGARGVRFERCTFSGLDGFAVKILGGSRDVSFSRCTFRDLGAGAVQVDGGDERSHPAARTRGVSVEDCEIADYGLDWASAVGILIKHADGNRIVHNWIHDGFYTAISVGWRWGYGDSVARDNLIEGNRIEHIGKGLLNDMGGIYLLGNAPGTIVRGNVVHDVRSWTYGGHAVYCDEGTQGVLIEKNLLYDAPHVFNIHYGRQIVFRNNIVAYGRDTLFNTGAIEPFVTLYCYGNIFYAGAKGSIVHPWERMTAPKPYSYRNAVISRIPKMSMRSDHAIADWNLFYKEGESREKGMKRLVDGGMNAHSIWADPGFADSAKGDFSLKPDSPARLIGFEPFDARTAGIRNK